MSTPQHIQEIATYINQQFALAATSRRPDPQVSLGRFTKITGLNGFFDFEKVGAAVAAKLGIDKPAEVARFIFRQVACQNDTWTRVDSVDNYSRVQVDGVFSAREMAEILAERFGVQPPVPALNLLETIAANVDNTGLDDREFRDFIRRSLPLALGMGQAVPTAAQETMEPSGETTQPSAPGMR